MPNQSLQEIENTYTIICDTIIKAVSSSKHYLYFLPDKRNIDNAIKLGALYMRDDYSNTSDLEKLGISEGILLPQDFNRDDFLDVLLNHQTIHSWKVMAYSEAYKDQRHLFLNPYQLSFTKGFSLTDVGRTHAEWRLQPLCVQSLHPFFATR